MCDRVVSQMRAIDVRSCRDSNDGCKYKESLAIVILSRAGAAKVNIVIEIVIHSNERN